jgi:hypothetical protein
MATRLRIVVFCRGSSSNQLSCLPAPSSLSSTITITITITSAAAAEAWAASAAWGDEIPVDDYKKKIKKDITGMYTRYPDLGLNWITRA